MNVIVIKFMYFVMIAYQSLHQLFNGERLSKRRSEKVKVNAILFQSISYYFNNKTKKKKKTDFFFFFGDLPLDLSLLRHPLHLCLPRHPKKSQKNICSY